jgi:hypothetical protein
MGSKMPNEMSKEFARRWHVASAAIAGRALEERDKDTFDILHVMSQICEACADSLTPYRLYNKMKEIQEAIEKENRHSNEPDPPPMPVSIQRSHIDPHSPDCACPDCTKLQRLNDDDTDAALYCG